ncbi:MAG: NAD(P)/FAD-dependent oxidoreductase, partial [Clostridia bacterium]|nr:NAD(P)/FAD-dependent oxidoreductase [Clostridia bacterium]
SSKLTEENLKDIIFEIKNFSFDVCGAYNNNQVLSGGVELENLSQDLYLLDDENIYFCGEICDVDGECGGYNLQWAWTSAMIVSNFIKKGV